MEGWTSSRSRSWRRTRSRRRPCSSAARSTGTCPSSTPSRCTRPCGASACPPSSWSIRARATRSSVPSYQKDRLERYLAWFGKYLKPARRERACAGGGSDLLPRSAARSPAVPEDQRKTLEENLAKANAEFAKDPQNAGQPHLGGPAPLFPRPLPGSRHSVLARRGPVPRGRALPALPRPPLHHAASSPTRPSRISRRPTSSYARRASRTRPSPTPRPGARHRHERALLQRLLPPRPRPLSEGRPHVRGKGLPRVSAGVAGLVVARQRDRHHALALCHLAPPREDGRGGKLVVSFAAKGSGSGYEDLLLLYKGERTADQVLRNATSDLAHPDSGVRCRRLASRERTKGRGALPPPGGRAGTPVGGLRVRRRRSRAREAAVAERP